MEDVIQNYLKSKRGQTVPAPTNTATKGEPASWTYPEAVNVNGTESEILRRTSLPYPLSGLFFLVDGHKQYPDSCHQLAEFLKTQCGQFPLEEVMQQAFQARFPRVWMERFLFILLEVQASDWQTAAYVLQFRHLKRLLLRVERHKPLNPVETTMAGEIIQTLGLSRFTDLEPFCRHACDIFKFMQSGRIPVSGDLGLLIYLIRCESVSMRERKNWLESDLAAGDPDSVAKMTPMLKHLEERMEKAQEMAERLGGYGPILNASMGLEEAMGPFFFGHLKESLAKLPELAIFRETLELQQTKRVPTRDLIALTSLCRWLLEARGLSVGPLDWVRMALEAYDHGRFRINIAGALPSVEILLSEAKVEREGTVVLGDFGENPYSSWIARDGLTRPFRSANPNRISPDLRPMVLANIHRDNIILKLIEHAKVHQTPGLIEAIVAGSVSVQVHSAIASRRELHSGSINGRVPLALLRSQVDIAPELLRPLVHPLHVSFTDIKSLYRAREGLRPAVVQELHSFLNQAYSL
jgi:hypothetical protein